jgi:hypothetical protein
MASIAYERLMVKLKNQSEFTHTTYLGGVNAGGLVAVLGWETKEGPASSSRL